MVGVRLGSRYPRRSPEAHASSMFPSPSPRIAQERFYSEEEGATVMDGRQAKVTGVGSTSMSSMSFW
jgi:hypothetical protein